MTWPPESVPRIFSSSSSTAPASREGSVSQKSILLSLKSSFFSLVCGPMAQRIATACWLVSWVEGRLSSTRQEAAPDSWPGDTEDRNVWEMERFFSLVSRAAAVNSSSAWWLQTAAWLSLVGSLQFLNL